MLGACPTFPRLPEPNPPALEEKLLHSLFRVHVGVSCCANGSYVLAESAEGQLFKTPATVRLAAWE